MAGATIRLIGPLITKLKKLSEKQDTINAFLKSKTAKNPANKKAKNIAEKRKKKVDEEHVKIKKQINQQVAEMDKPKPKPKSKQILRKDRGNLKKGGIYQRQMQTQKFRSYRGIDAEIDKLQKKKAKEGLTELEQNKLDDMIKKWKTKKEGGKVGTKTMDQYNLMDDLEKLMKYESKKKKVHKKPMGGKVYKNTVSRKHGGAIGTGAALRGFGKGYKKG